MPQVMLIMAIVAAAQKAIGSIQQGNAQAAALRSQAQGEEYNASIADQNATASYGMASAQESQQRARARDVLGKQAAAMGGNGVDITSGSPLAVARQSAANAELDSLMIQYQGDLRARGFTEQGVIDRWNAENDRVGASNAKHAGVMGALTGIESSAASYAGSVRPTTQPDASSMYGGYGSTLYGTGYGPQ